MMESQILFKRKMESSIIIVLVGFCFGVIYPIFGDDLNDGIAFVNGITIGVLGGVLLSFFEYFVFRIDSRSWSFIALLIVKTILYFVLFTLLIVTVMCFTRSLENGLTFQEYFRGEEFQTFIVYGDFKVILIYCLIILVIINFTREINRKIGYGILINYILGKYHKPREEERIFAFIDLKNSTQIAESLGDLKFHKLLNEFFHDISFSVLITKGEIYRYVGDEIVISWKLKYGLNNANCLRVYYFMKQRLKKQMEKYLKLFGFVPDFHTAFHAGKVVKGEIGDVKSQFVFHGETMYIASLIEKECGKLQHDLLISSDLVRLITIPVIYEIQMVGKLTGDERIELFTLTEKTEDQVTV